jgi:hypothetical protein
MQPSSTLAEELAGEGFIPAPEEHELQRFLNIREYPYLRCTHAPARLREIVRDGLGNNNAEIRVIFSATETA